MNKENDVNPNEEPIEQETILKYPSVFRNYISLIGAVLAVASLTCIVLLILLELTSSSDQPYLGILIYILLPGVMVFGLAVFLVGGIWERIKRRKMSPEEIMAYPILDLNGPRRRKMFFTFLFCSFIFLMISAFGSYRAFEYTESVEFCGQLCHSVMNPEFTAYNAAAHSQIRCVECHVGGGAEHYFKSKFAGVRQLYQLTMGTYSKPIHTPVKNMRAANETCGKCHWTEKYYGQQIRIFNHYGYDEKNSLNQTRLLVKVGGGSPAHGEVGGIHWHMNLSNDVQFIASDEQRQIIQWVRMKDKDGKTVEYFANNAKLSPDQIEKAEKRKMDCIDCHNRPTHIYLSPNQAVDQSLDAKRIDVSLPFVKMKAVEVLSGEYNTNDEAVNAIATNFPAYYKTTYPDIYNSKKTEIDAAVTEIQNIYQTYFFPEMKTDWRAHPNNIGHRTSQGCFRCHNGEMTSKDGKTITKDCATCHTTLDQTFDGKTIAPADGRFQHPVNLGDFGNFQCASCHQGNRGFKHPLNLGDISKFQCSECHQSGNYKMSIKPVSQ
jgi:nitrate/TMAO reductase-like tetraheme cytochrome c subunit